MSSTTLSHFGSIQIVYTVHCVRKEKIKRTWKERLLSRPWRPLATTKEVEVPAMFIVNPKSDFGKLTGRPHDFIICHPQLKQKLEETLTNADARRVGRTE